MEPPVKILLFCFSLNSWWEKYPDQNYTILKVKSNLRMFHNHDLNHFHLTGEAGLDIESHDQNGRH